MLEHEYDFYLADTDEGKSIHFGLRYQVYCLREKYEDPIRNPNYLEQDEYDDRSVHFIARSRITGEWLGAMRLIVGPAQSLPVSKFSSLHAADFSHADWKRVAEASRLCTVLPRNSRSNSTAGTVGASVSGFNSHATFAALSASTITVGLIRASRRYSLQHGIVHCFFLVTDSFARLLKRLGMEIEPVGSPCQHRGWRRPYAHNFVTGYRDMEHRSPELYRTFCQANAYMHYSESAENIDHTPIAAIA